MKKSELIKALQECSENSRKDDTENSHRKADLALLDFIDDAEIEESFLGIRRWYS